MESSAQVEHVIYTVLGQIDPSQLGATSMHEHLLIDARVWYVPPRDEFPATPKVSIENLGFLRLNLLSLEDNLIMDDPDLAIRELKGIVRLGGAGIVDLTVPGIGRQVRELPRIARKTGLHVMVATGLYLHDSHPDWARQASVEELATYMVGELRDGIDGTGIRPALIGEIGTSNPVTDREWQVVRAAGRAGAVTGCTVNIHLDPRGDHAFVLLDVLCEEGMQPERVIFSHVDERREIDYALGIAARGAVVSFDTFGSDFYFSGAFKDPTDEERFQYVRAMINAGYHRQLVFGCDVWVKAALRAYGGMGYEHLFLRVIPTLSNEYEVSREVLDQVLVHTPRRLLARPQVGA
jgi:phosphotriesterase-related protein